MKHLIIFGAAALALALGVPTGAAHHNCDSPATIIDVGGQAYVVVQEDDHSITGHDVWFAIESNGQPGPQRGGVTLLGDADVCQNSANPDMGLL